MAISYGTYTITEVQEGSQIWTSSAAPTTPNYTFDVSKLVGDSETSIKSGDIIMHSYNRYTVLSVSSDGKTVLAGNLQSIRGATGAASVTYTLIVSNLAIIKDKDGNLSPSTITVTAKSQTGSKAMTNYTGRIKIETTTNNSTWTSRINEDAATKTYTIPSDTVAIRCSLYLKGGTTTLLDQQTVPVVSDGTNITITSTSVTYQKGTSGTVKPTGTWETGVQSVGQGEYLWTRTIVNYSDGSSTEAYSVSRNAVNGTNGTNGKDGKNGTSPTVSSTVTEYAQSTNGTTPPTSGWDTTPKTATAGQYMWTRVTVTYSDSATAVSYTVSKNGTNGTNGINTATVYLYKKGTTAPSVPSGNTTYTFSTKKLTGTLDSWTQEIPTTGSGQCYVTAAVASSNGTTDTIGTGEWSAPIQFNGTNGTNGTDGTNGLNQATIFLYKRGASVTKPTTSVTYTFSTGALSAEPNSWKRNIPTIDGNPCWVVTATAIGNGTTATITGSNWSDPVKLVEDGADGYTVVLTNENHTFAGNSISAIASEIECNVIAYKGTTQIAATIGTITGQPTGMTTSLLNNGTVNSAFKVTVTTSMATMNGVLTVPVTVDGKTFTKKFTYSLALKGTSGTSENLLMDVYASSLTKVDAPWNRYFSDASNSTITGQFIAEDNLPDPNATHFVRLTDSSASTKGRGLCFYSSGTPPFIDGHTYRIGCWVRKYSGSPKMNITLGGYESWMPTQRIIDNTDWEWIEVVRTFGDNTNSIWDTYKRLYFYFYNNNVAGSSLDMCGFKMEEVQVNSGTARNFILGTEKLANWVTKQGATISNGIITFPAVTVDTWREVCSAKSFKYDLIRNQYVIFSIKVKADNDKKCRFYLNVSIDNNETTHIRQKYFDQYIYFTGDGEWQTICLAVPVFDYMFKSGSGTVDFDDCWVAIRFGAANNYWNGFQAKEPQLCLGTTATSWSRAPEDFDAEISTKADSSSAVTEEQYIYIQATSGTNSVNPTTIWITEDGESTISDTQGLMPVWTTKRPTYRSNYPVIFIAKQRKTVSGTVTCTTPTKDDTLTIIDGGHITTGTIDASKVTVTNIDASKITTGTLRADCINTKSISIGDFKDGDDYAKTEDMNIAIGNIEVGGRNLVWNSNFQLPINGTWNNWGTPTTREIVTIDGTNWIHIITTASKYQGYQQSEAHRNGFGEIQAGDKIIFSYDAYSGVDGQQGCIGVHWKNSSGTNVSQNWVLFDLTTTKKRYVTQVFTVPNNAVGFNIMVGQGTAVAQELWITNIKAEKGTKATDWTPAPEDIDANITTVQTNADAVNLSPFFSYSPYVANNYWQGWSNHNGYTYTDMGDGWMRVQYTNTTSSFVRRDFRPFVNRQIKEGSDYTFLFEFRNNHSTGSATGTDFYIVENNNCQFWGSAIKESIEGAGNYTTTNIINNVPEGSTDIYKKRFVKVSEASGSKHWTDGSINNVNGLVTFTTRCGANTTIDYEVRVSIYEGRYFGEYKPYVDSGSTSKIDTRTGWSILINVSAIDYSSNTATLHATVYKDGIVQTSGFTLQWYKTYTTTNITPEETTTQLITGATTNTLNVTDLDASYTCIVN